MNIRNTFSNPIFLLKVATQVILLLTFGTACTDQTNEEESKRPNIILILADDLGYGELGCYGQEKIETPNIDRLAEEGMRFTQFYSGAPVCAPARYVLLTGKHSGHTYIRGNHEWESRGDVWSYEAMIADSTLEGQFPMPANTTTIARQLSAAGYKTAMIGKWGLGAPHTESIPTEQGFDFFCGYNCQRQAHTYYPVHLYKNENRIHLSNDTIAPRTNLEENSDPLNMESYSDFNLTDYAPDVMFTEMMNWIDESKNEPFFLYWATPLPHLPLQAPQRWVDYYVDKFGDEEPYTGDKGYFPNRCPNAAYAGMISCLDERIGQMVQKLKDEGVYENTLIIFTSDNGPTYTGGVDAEWFNSAGPFNNTYGWTKGFLHEGGIRVPMIACWPDHIQAGSESDHIAAFYDLLPTFCELSKTETPEEIDGISFLPTLLSDDNQPSHEYLYWEFPEYGGQQAVRWGDWKGIRKEMKNGNLQIELYNLQDDIREENDVADAHPEIVEQIEKFMSLEHQPSVIERFRLVGSNK